AVFDYMAFSRTDQDENTFFSGIKKLEPGCSISIKDNKLKIHEWYDLRSNIKEPFANALDFREVFKSAVGLRLQSDVPLGVCLSGGLDSSSITSTLLKDFSLSDLKTFSAIYEKNQNCDESEYIYEYKDVLKNMHFTTPSAETLINDLSDFLKAHGEPTPSAASYAQYRVMKSAKGKIVVTLDGQGADEQLAGYHFYFSFFFKGLLREFRLFKLFSEIYHYLNIHRSIHSLKIFLYHILPEKFRTGTKEKGYLTKTFSDAFFKTSIVERLYDSKNLNESLINHFEKKLAIILKWEDRNSMWHSLESRVPFLDHRIVEKTLSLPGASLINNGMTKVILRESMKGLLPEKIRLRQDKIGFGTPQDEWFRQPAFQKYIWEMLNSEEFKNRNIIDCKKAKSIYQKHLDHKQNFADEIWKWINLDLWFKEYIN
ncbi:MAG: asparagine synthetase B, partial [Candidatus Aminicenantes bacterium]|nr:asparagine synthetase B [Candidatus Aminicenantes bacterium]